MKKRIVIITGSELRHEFMRKYLASSQGIEVLKTYCESEKGNVQKLVQQQDENTLRVQHLSMREQTEKDFFELYCKTTADNSNPEYITKGDINLQQHTAEIKALNPDLIIAYGCSIIRSSLITDFAGRFINIHLGLSPYYRGSGTNFWPFVNGEPEYVGVTYMYIDQGVDTGKVIHQIRPHINYGDNIHQIGNRLIRDMVICCADLIKQFDKLEDTEPLTIKKETEKYYRKKDFTESSVELMYKSFSEGLINKFLSEKESRLKRVPVLENNALKTEL